jgi:hypothetical protein
VARRRRPLGLRGWSALATALLLAPAVALAAEGAGGKKGPVRDLTSTRGNFEIRYGSIDVSDANIRSVYGSSGNNILQLEVGPQLFRLFELDVGIGFFQEIDHTIASDGAASTEKTMLTWFPLTLDGTARLQFWDEQILVPHARIGFDYLMWNEKWDDGSGGKDMIRGAKAGNHFGLGGALLLDPLAPARASLLEAQSGINDTFVIVEWRRQNVSDGQGLDFSGTMVTVGLKLDF